MKLLKITVVLTAFILAAAAAMAAPPNDVPPDPRLVEHNNDFPTEVIKVTDGIYVAVGFGLANSGLIVGDGGNIVIDTMECVEEALPVKAEFDKISKQPVEAIIYTHNHADHVFGAVAFAGDNKPEVISQELTGYYLDRFLNIINPVVAKRAARMFGTLLPEGYHINCGIGPHLGYKQGMTIGVLRPTKTVKDRLELEIAGIKMVLISAPGETNDQMYVWLPEKKVLFIGDNFYKAFPNLYTIRGTSYRDVTKWVKGIDIARALKPEYLILGHTLPLKGKDEIYKRLTNYRDAIQYVHDQTIRGINQDKSPDEIVAELELPKHLAEDPYLIEYYGMVPWSVRNIYNGYLGWFSGKAKDLFPMSPKEQALRLAELAGGADKLLAAATKAFDKNQNQWALELSDAVLVLQPANKDAKILKAKAIKGIVAGKVNANARNYLLTKAMETTGEIVIPNVDKKKTRMEVIESVPIDRVFESMAVRLNPKKAAEMDMVVGFYYPDLDADYTVHIRRGVAEVQKQRAENPAVRLTMDSNKFKAFMAGKIKPKKALSPKNAKLEGEPMKLMVFLDSFR